MAVRAFGLVVLLVTGTLHVEVDAHQQPSFPGQNAHQPPEVHHQAHAQQQQAAAPAPSSTQPGAEHLEGKVDPTANMTPEQLQFHYFNMHDLDKNGRLDGVELIKAITHFHQENPTNQHTNQHVPPPLPSEVELEQMIDSILKEDDFNSDGFIDYGEFLRAQKQREEQARLHQQNAPPPPPPR
ncbi:Multiple coagulation factor deficiency protein 2-like protein [Aphelenchoides fujianensis]|nr:Multiple coagulation factor deficiency protein 2-like protein [Aphelenchoides fujianensis]